MKQVTITDVRAFVLEQAGSGGDYHDREQGHWLVDTLIATPMSAYPEYKQSRTSFGMTRCSGPVGIMVARGCRSGQ